MTRKDTLIRNTISEFQSNYVALLIEVSQIPFCCTFDSCYFKKLLISDSLFY